MSLERIVFEKINDNFGWGQYGEFRVLIRLSDNYINATKLCSSGGKQFKNWIRLDGSQELCNKLLELGSVLSQTKQIIEQVTAGDYETRGTYVHPELVPHIASWIYPEFAIKVSRIVNEHIVREYEWELNKKKDTINSLEAKVDTLLSELKEARNDIGKVSNQLDTANENIVDTLDNLGAISHERVPLHRAAEPIKEQLVLLHLQGNQYKVIRAQRRVVWRTVANYRSKYPSLRKVLVIDNHPNPKELWNAIRDQLKRDGYDVKSNDTLLKIRSETQLVNIFHAKNAERFDVFNEVKTNIDREEEEAPQNDDIGERVKELLRTKTLNDLKEMCRTKGIKGWSKLKKIELAHFIASNE
jgi:3-dehydroquinate dehydratase